MLNNGFQDRNQIFNVGDLLFEHQYVGVFKNAFHRIRVGHEIGREVTAIELHTFNPFDFGFEAFAFVDSDNAIFTNFFHGSGQLVADFSVVVGSDATNVSHVVFAFHFNRHLVKLFGDVGYSQFDTRFHLNRVYASNNRFETFVEDRFGHYRCSRRTVTSHIARFACDFSNHSGAHVFVDVFQVDFLRNGDTVLRNGWRTKALLKNNVSSLGAERNFDGTSKFGNATTNRFASFLIKRDNFGH